MRRSVWVLGGLCLVACRSGGGDGGASSEEGVREVVEEAEDVGERLRREGLPVYVSEGCVLGRVDGVWYASEVAGGEPVPASAGWAEGDAGDGAVVAVDGACFSAVVSASGESWVWGAPAPVSSDVPGPAQAWLESGSGRLEWVQTGLLDAGQVGWVWERGELGVRAHGAVPAEVGDEGELVVGWPEVPSPVRAPVWRVWRSTDDARVVGVALFP